MLVRDHMLQDAAGRPVGFIESPNTGGGLSGGRPRFAIIHYTAGGSAAGAIATFGRQSARVSAHLVVDRGGQVTQMVPFDRVAWHAGASRWGELSGLNAHSVGIEIVNWGRLIGGPGRWKAWTGQAIADDRVIEAAHPNRPGHIQGWEVYDEGQIQAVIAILSALGDAYGIGAETVLGHEDISPRRKTDPGPAWDMERMRARAFGRAEDGHGREMRRVLARSGLHLRSGPGTGHGSLALMAHGREVVLLGAEGDWRLVAAMDGEAEDVTGWAHGHWLGPL